MAVLEGVSALCSAYIPESSFSDAIGTTFPASLNNTTAIAPQGHDLLGGCHRHRVGPVAANGAIGMDFGAIGMDFSAAWSRSTPSAKLRTSAINSSVILVGVDMSPRSPILRPSELQENSREFRPCEQRE